MRKFQDTLGLNKEIKRNQITVKNKKIFNLLERVNLEIDFLKEGVTVSDFIKVLTEDSDKKIHLNIDNRSFYYLLSKIKEYFFNFSYTVIAKTNKIYSKGGKLIQELRLCISITLHDSLKTQIFIEFKAKKRVTISDYSCSSGNWTRTSDLRVMSPTSYLLLYPAM